MYFYLDLKMRDDWLFALWNFCNLGLRDLEIVINSFTR